MICQYCFQIHWWLLKLIWMCRLLCIFLDCICLFWRFMAQSTLLMSCRASPLTYSHFSRAGLDLPGSEAVLSTTAPAFPPVISRFFKMKLMKQVLFFSTHYALVICNHALTPTHRAGPDIAGKMRPSFDFALSPQCRVKVVFFCLVSFAQK